MLLAVDIGNTSTKFGFYSGGALSGRGSFATVRRQNKGSLDEKIGNSFDGPITDAIICSVVPEALALLLNYFEKRQIDTVSVTSEMDFGFSVAYEPLAAVGTDRLVSSLSAIEKYGSPAIICSFGTATTIDVIDRDRGYLGGIIAPGIRTAAASLKLNTSQLPEIKIEKPDRLIGNSTVSAIRSGIILGHVAMVEGLIDRIRNEIGSKPFVVVTGGFASLVAGMTEIIDTVDENLILDGLRILHERIAQK